MQGFCRVYQVPLQDFLKLYMQFNAYSNPFIKKHKWKPVKTIANIYQLYITTIPKNIPDVI